MESNDFLNLLKQQRPEISLPPRPVTPDSQHVIEATEGTTILAVAFGMEY